MGGTGLPHVCATAEAPFLSFHYDEDKKVICGCSAFPHWGSNYIARDLCAGHRCDSEQHPVLDYDEKEGQCVCRVNPCWDIAGNAHSCKEGFPILRYREDSNSDGS